MTLPEKDCHVKILDVIVYHTLVLSYHNLSKTLLYYIFGLFNYVGSTVFSRDSEVNKKKITVPSEKKTNIQFYVINLM